MMKDTSTSTTTSTHHRSPIATAIDLNNKACELLHAGEDEEFVLELFGGAIDYLRSNSVNIPSDPQSVAAAAAAFRTTTLSTSDDDTHMRGDTKLALDATITFFDRLVLIDKRNAVTTELFPIFAGCILLNMAVTYHKMGTRFPDGTQVRTQLLAKAKQLYQMVYQSLSVNVVALSDTTSVALRTVAIHNLADLSFQLGDDNGLEATVRLARHLRPLIVLQQQQLRYISSNQGLLSPRDLHRMVLNLSYWRHPNLAAAA